MCGIPCHVGQNFNHACISSTAECKMLAKVQKPQKKLYLYNNIVTVINVSPLYTCEPETTTGSRSHFTKGQPIASYLEGGPWPDTGTTLRCIRCRNDDAHLALVIKIRGIGHIKSGLVRHGQGCSST